MKQNFITINKTGVEDGWGWFVFKKRSQRARKQRLRKTRSPDTPYRNFP
jgi:hypothetical protein